MSDNDPKPSTWLPDNAPRQTGRASPPKQDSPANLVAGFIVLVVIVGSIVHACTRDSDNGTTPSSTVPAGEQSGGELRGTKKLVESTCEQAVENRLKSPGSAEFSSLTTTQLDSDGTRWSVTGSVDSDNSFGASIRNTFTCSSTYDIATETAHTNVTAFSGN